ncbi:mRNA-decapping enzyme subunit 2 [Ceratobasidium sp. 394]|nr:mRNA-decapping enzyme subunit 2 [Ceratobasidium sp. 394]
MPSQPSTSAPPEPTVPGMVPGTFSFKNATWEDVWEDLSSRFILNVPDEELETVERICFQVEQAHWFYEDFVRDENPDLPSLPLKKFSQQLFAACPLLSQWSTSQEHEQAFQEFMRYKTRVPVCGTIMLNPALDKCVLVKGWKASSGWGFPKGKINEDEEEYDCAIRETLEETGFDVTSLLNRNDFIKNTLKEQQLTLYIIPDVPEDTVFQTRTRKEISKIEWFKLSDLPTWKKNRTVAPNSKFYLISPFVGQLKAFVSERKRQRRAARKSGRTPAIAHQQPYHPSHSQVDLELETASPFRPNARPHERYDADLAIPPRASDLWDDVEPEHTQAASLAVRIGRDSESSSQNSTSTNALTSGSSAHASAVEPITPSSDTPYAGAVYVKSAETGPSGEQPHLARLLQGLTLSAAAAEPTQPLANDDTPKNNTSGFTASPAEQNPTKSIFDFVSPFDQLASPVTKGTPTPPLQHNVVGTSKPVKPADRGTTVPTGQPHSSAPPAPPAAFADLGLVPASLTSKSPVLQKRFSVTPQPSNVLVTFPAPSVTPAPGNSTEHPMDRRRKQLALLESVANDADRLITPAQTPLLSSRTPAAQFLNYYPMPGGQFHPPPPAERQQYPMGMVNGAPRQTLPPSPLYSRPVQTRMVGPENNVHKGHLLNMLSYPAPSATPVPHPGPPNQGYHPPMYHNSQQPPHPQGPSPMPPYGAPMYPTQPQYAGPTPNANVTNGGFPPAAGLLSILNNNTNNAPPHTRPYPTSGLS